MSDIQIGLLSIVGILLLIQSGMHVSVALLLLSFCGVWAMKENGIIAGKMLSLAAAESISSYAFGVIPLFVLMGLVVGASDIGRDTFDVCNRLFRRMRGGLGVSTVAANAVFAAVQGTTIASASVFTKVAVPELIRLGYTPRFSVGVVAGSSVLGMLIPPSLLLILYGIVAEVSIGQMFTAGIMPGILMAFAFVVLIGYLVRRHPKFVGEGALKLTPPNPETDASAMQLAGLISPILILIAIVLGGIYGGLFTPTEAGGVGALAALLIAVLKRRLSWAAFKDVLIETGYVTASISFLLIAAHLYANMLALSGLPDFMGHWIETTDIGLVGVLIVYLIAIILLGTILDSASIMLILLPLVVPVMAKLGVDLVWFGIITVIAVEIGLLTPPLGIACFVIRANLEDDGITLGDIFRGAAPFALTMLIVLALVVAIPWLATGLL
ncbi:MAG: C4-dicarboxylate transporter DctM subunit [Paracoccaceae bacterium]|jgi:C4-dicarboxylate transporter DctM subunit